MCFPCLKKKPQLKDYEPTTDLSDQFEYVVEKYTIRKVPLLLANTAEDIIERQEELEMAETQVSQPEFVKNDFPNFQMAQEMFNVQRVPPCITVAANTVCPVGRKSTRERPKPSDVLESMSPIARPAMKNTNYVVIPTKASLRSKDIMMTKREITNQYLNNFSSVFVDNLKDQVPKDPENFPSLSRPYTSAFKNIPFADTFLKVRGPTGKKIKKNKTQRVAYSFPTEEFYGKEESSLKEELYANEANSIKEEEYYDSDSGSKEQTTDAPESEFQEDNENEAIDITDKSKSFILLNDTDSLKDVLDASPKPFKTTIKSSTSEFENNYTGSPESEADPQVNSYACQKDEWTNSKVTYEDIQALDVGYEFTSCEKLGVKPKMTRIHYPHESERGKEPKQIGDSKMSKKSFYLIEQPHVSLSRVCRPSMRSKQHQRISDHSFLGSSFNLAKEKVSSRSLVTETSFLPKLEVGTEFTKKVNVDASEIQGAVSTITFTSKSEESKSLNDIDLNACPSELATDSIAEISNLYDLALPLGRNQTAPPSREQQVNRQPEETIVKFPAPCKSRSFQEAGRSSARVGNSPEGKGKNFPTYSTNTFVKKKSISRLNEPETETSCSLLSRDSKTSSAVTSPRSERDEGKRATLRWKIVIKHHRDEDSSRKNVNKNIKL